MNLHGIAFFLAGQRDEAGSNAMVRKMRGRTNVIGAQRC